MHITITWKKYKSFFDLCAKHLDDKQLIYVIGEEHHCYIGSIGSRGGQDGLRTRYQRQYLQRACAIFGLDENSAQVAYCGKLYKGDDSINKTDILAMEAIVQHKFIQRYGIRNTLFKPEKHIDGYEDEHYRGEDVQDRIPPFLVGI